MRPPLPSEPAKSMQLSFPMACSGGELRQLERNH
jgi:hypothetical protein